MCPIDPVESFGNRGPICVFAVKVQIIKRGESRKLLLGATGKRRLSLEIHANCFNMYLVVENKFSYKSGMINIYKFYNVELKLYWQIFTKS